MKTIRKAAGFTLVELLTVIAIIAILAAMLLPVLSRAKVAAQKTKAKTEIASIVNAIQSYDSTYSRFPITAAEQTAAGANDFTTGYVPNPQTGVTWPSAGGSYSFNNNSNVVAILMDNANVPANANHVKNPKQVVFLNADMKGDTTSPGVGSDLVYRDPWGNPYIITMNTSYDEQGTKDLVYSLRQVSQDGSNSKNGFNGLFNPVDANGNGNHFLHRGKVMVWSAGPDKQVNPGIPANTGVNKDNVLSWQ